MAQTWHTAFVACIDGSVASTREFADGGGEAAANADGVALRAADHAVESVGNEEHGIVAGLHEAALLLSLIHI